MSTPVVYGNFTDKIYSNIQSEIKRAQNDLNKSLEEIGNIRKQTYVRIFYYILIILAMFAFAYIVLSDVYTTLKNYADNKQDDAPTPNIDDYVYVTDDDSKKSISASILSELQTADSNVKATFDPLLEFRARHNLDNSLYTRVNPKSLGTDDDTYKYDLEKPSTSFWSMLFDKPTYYSIVNADPRNALRV